MLPSAAMKLVLLKPVVLLAGLCALSMSFGCEDEEAENSESAEPILGIMEMPISFRHQPAAPNNAIQIEASPSRLRLDGTTVLEWESGRVPEASQDGMVIRELATALAAAPTRSAAALSLHANVPYETTGRILATLQAANVHEAAFAVRAGTSTDPGWLVLPRFEVREEVDEYYEWPASHTRGWGELDAVWSDMYSACREDHYVDCAFKAQNIAEGGNMHITLFARGNAVKVDLHRFGAPDPEPTSPSGPELIEGIAADPAEMVEEAPPAVTAAFTWRFEASVQEDSPLSKTMRPLCGVSPCGVLMVAEGQTQTMRIVSFLGSAFPNGTEAPLVMFQVPR